MAAVLAAVPCFAADSAILRNGFSIRHERRQVIGTVTRLYLSSDNSSLKSQKQSSILYRRENLPKLTHPLSPRASRLRLI
jgi:hypothetical protein